MENNNDTYARSYRSYRNFLFVVGFLFGFFSICGGFAFYRIGKLAEAVELQLTDKEKPIQQILVQGLEGSKSLAKGLKNFESTSESTKVFAEAFLTQRQQEEWNNYLTKQAASALGTTNNTRKLADHTIKISQATEELINNYLKPLLSNINGQVTLRSNDISELAKEIKDQINKNGNASEALLIESKNTLVATEQELIPSINKTVQELHTSLQGISIITNDPNLAASLKNSNAILGNVEVITRGFAKVVSDVAFPSPPKNAFDKYFIRPGKFLVKFIVAAGNLLVLIDKFQ